MPRSVPSRWSEDTMVHEAQFCRLSSATLPHHPSGLVCPVLQMLQVSARSGHSDQVSSASSSWGFQLEPRRRSDAELEAVWGLLEGEITSIFLLAGA